MTGTRNRGLLGWAALLVLIQILAGCRQGPEDRLTEAPPAEEGLSPFVLARIPALVKSTIDEGRAPGVLVLVGRNGRIIYRHVQGDATVVPQIVPLRTDAVFDMASLTKPIATATCVMKLVEEGRIELHAPVARYLPGFRGHSKESITVEHLLRHRGGLLPDNALRDYQQGPAVARQRIFDLGLRADPGIRFIYTDVGFILLAWIVEAVTRKSLADYAHEVVFEPLGMTSTRFLPIGGTAPEGYLKRCVPTDPAKPGAAPLQGVVHDPRCRLLGGVAGHAGLFSSADDLARFASMLLNGGTSLEGRRILKPQTKQLL